MVSLSGCNLSAGALGAGDAEETWQQKKVLHPDFHQDAKLLKFTLLLLRYITHNIALGVRT